MQDTPEKKKQHLRTVQLILRGECTESTQHSFLSAICCCGKRDTTVKQIRAAEKLKPNCLHQKMTGHLCIQDQ